MDNIKRIIKNLTDASRRLRSLGFLQNLTRQILDQPDLEKVLEDICSAGQKIAGTPYVYILLVDTCDKTQMRIRTLGKFKREGEKPELPVKTVKIGGGGITGRCAKLKESQNVPNVSEHPDYIICFPDVKSELAIPLLDKKKNFYGVFNLENTKFNHFTTERQYFAEQLAEVAVIGIQQALFREQDKKKTILIESMNAVDKCALDPNIKIDQALTAALDGAIKLTGADCGHIQILEPETNQVVIRVWRGEILPKARMRFTIGKHGISGWVAKHLCAFRTGNVNELKPPSDPEYIPTFEGVLSELTVPIIYQSTYIGNIDLNKRVENWFAKEDEDRIMRLADQVSLALLVARQWDQQCQVMALDAIEESATFAAHHMKTILAGQGAHLDALEKELNGQRRLSEQEKGFLMEHITPLRENNNNLIGTYNRILNSRHREPEISELDLNLFMKQTFQLLGLENKPYCTLLDAEEHIVVFSDRNIISEILSNIVSNALDAVKEVENPSITISYGYCMERRESFFILVKDNGPGIGPDEINRVFMPLYSSKSGSIGIGLPTSKNLAKRLKGDLMITSERGVGTSCKLIAATGRKNANFTEDIIR